MEAARFLTGFGKTGKEVANPAAGAASAARGQSAAGRWIESSSRLRPMDPVLGVGRELPTRVASLTWCR